jgi:hypothetical protein
MTETEPLSETSCLKKNSMMDDVHSHDYCSPFETVPREMNENFEYPWELWN